MLPKPDIAGFESIVAGYETATALLDILEN